MNVLLSSPAPPTGLKRLAIPSSCACEVPGSPAPELCQAPWVSGAGRAAHRRPCVCSLIQLEAFLRRLCCTCEAAYRVLRWENPTVSSQWVPLCSHHHCPGGICHLSPGKAGCLEGPGPLTQGKRGLQVGMHCFCMAKYFNNRKITHHVTSHPDIAADPVFRSTSRVGHMKLYNSFIKYVRFPFFSFFTYHYIS